ncbi:transposase [Autumnicola lenta]|uniref:transposase n=1 Tax=Autumnicola lenta TaxID=3075593 RepID=UPI003D784ED9
MYNLSDEKLVGEHWEMNAYFQYFGDLQLQKWVQPCAASDLVHFRQRIGKSGVEKIFRNSI